MLKTQRMAAIGINSRVVCGRISNATRIMEKWPNFISTPACNILVAAGAAAWPTGDHECNGQIGAMEAKPKKISNQITVAIGPENLACSRRTRILKVFRPEKIGRASCRERV